MKTKSAKKSSAKPEVNDDLIDKLKAINSVQSVIEFTPDGTIISANEKFSEIFGYSLGEFQGKHHSIFVDNEYKDSDAYKKFWKNLRKGERQSGEFKRYGKNQEEIWISGDYHPIKNDKGEVIKVIEFGNDSTQAKLERADISGQIKAISRSQAVIEFNMDGTIISANENFLNTMGYTLDEVKGQHHSIFVEPSYKQSAEYKLFWKKLQRGEFESGEFKRLGKNRKEVWIQATYTPILDLNGKPFKVVKFATDVTKEKMLNADFSGQLAAISRSQAVIEFNMDGTIISANENFLNTMGYTLDEVKGQHHSIFVEPSYKQSAEYKLFWDKLQRGEFESGEFKRLGKNGKEVWIQATYTPILDLNGKPYKVVKYAQDVTKDKIRNSDYAGQISAIQKSLAVVEFDLEGKILTANENFLNTVNYSLKDIQGKHHSMFVDPTYRESSEYRLFWEQLNQGKFDSGEYKRFGKNGKEIWIQAAYNPIFDLNGTPFKVVKYAIDITKQKLLIEEGRAKVKAEMTETLDKLNYQNQLKTGIEAITKLIRGEIGVTEVGTNVLEKLSEIMDIKVGAFFILKDEKLELTSTYAYQTRKNLSNVFRIGEGIVGQCAKEKKSIVISNVPTDYIKINSSLGESTPSTIMTVPVLLEGKLLGVFEIAKFNEFSDIELQILEGSAESISIALNSSRTREQVNNLLEDSRNKTEELQQQQEKLSCVNEELQNQQEELRVSNEELENQTEVLKKSELAMQQKNEELKDKTEVLQQKTQEMHEKSKEVEKSKATLEQKARELELASKYKSEFLANMSHELRTPLNSLLILSQSLSENEEGNLTPEQIEIAGIIHNGGNDLLNLINDILDLSKVEAGKLHINFEEVNLATLVENLQRQFNPVSKQKDIKFNLLLSSDDTFPSTIKTDGQRIEQILKNFLSNAFKFTEKGSVSLKISTPSPETSFRNPTLTQDNCLAFSVSDTGIGITKEKQALVFEAFQQEDGSTSREFGGTGLGLSISRELAKLLNCEIHIESEKNIGSTFTLYVPLQYKESDSASNSSMNVVNTNTSQALPEETQTSFEPMSEEELAKVKPFIPDDRKDIEKGDRTLLVIEDDINFAKILYDYANKQGYKCIVTNIGKEGLAFAIKYSPIGITLDKNLPDINGGDLLEIIKSNPNTANIPVHIITVDDNKQLSLQKGAIGHLIKPTTSKELVKAMTDLAEINLMKFKEVLLVEDSKNDQKAISKLLKKSKMSMSYAESGKEAIKCIRENNYDCVILDLTLPDISGLEVLRQLSQTSNVTLPPVIVYSGKDLTKEEYQQLNEYTSNFITKGVNASDRLLEALFPFLDNIDTKQTPIKAEEDLKVALNTDESLQGRKVLLVDDDMRNTFALTTILRKKGIKVVMADNGKLALDKLKSEPDIELVIMDIMMPVMDGYEAMKEIRKQKEYRKLPIIALTAKTLPEDKAKALEAGANDFLTKPVDLNAMFGLMGVWLTRNLEMANKN